MTGSASTGPPAQQPPTKWVFGNAPLEQTRRFAAVARRVVSAILQSESASTAIDDLIAALERAESRLTATTPHDPMPRVGEHCDGDGRIYLDHSRDVGDYHPFFPVYTLTVTGDRAEGSVHFPVAYEGPPGVVHGGFVALLFDLAIQQHNCDVGVAGRTTRLEVGYTAPTPLVTDLRIEIERTVQDRRIESTARLYDGDTLCATGVMRAVAGARERLPEVSPRRSA